MAAARPAAAAAESRAAPSGAPIFFYLEAFRGLAGARGRSALPANRFMSVTTVPGQSGQKCGVRATPVHAPARAVLRTNMQNLTAADAKKVRENGL